MTSPRASDLELKIPIEGGNASPFDFGENVVAVHFESSYPKQGHEQMQSSYFEVEKAIGTDRNQRSMRLTGQQEVIKYRREVSHGSFRNLLREIDDQRSVDMEYPELCGLFFGKQRVSRKEKWNRLNLKNQLSMGVWRKRKKNSKNENEWRRSSLQASEEERSVDKVGKVELFYVRASNCDLTTLLLRLWVITPYLIIETHNWMNISAIKKEVHML